MEDTAREQKGALTLDPVVQVFANAIVDSVASYAASSRREVEHSLRTEAARIASENDAVAVDAAGRRWLTLCSVHLRGLPNAAAAGGRRSGLPRSAAVGDDPTVHRRNHSAFLRDRFGISQDALEEAFERIAEMF